MKKKLKIALQDNQQFVYPNPVESKGRFNLTSIINRFVTIKVCLKPINIGSYLKEAIVNL
jgi:hypothetical protein